MTVCIRFAYRLVKSTVFYVDLLQQRIWNHVLNPRWRLEPQQSLVFNCATVQRSEISKYEPEDVQVCNP
jgi:hypothetical protein